MTEYTQHTSNRERFENPVTVSFRTNLINRFYDVLTEGATDTGCHYFAHNLIKNREEPMMQSFSNNSDWRITYWEDYWDCNPLDYESYTIVKANGYVCLGPSQNGVEPNCDVTEDKKLMCKMDDGFHFYIQRDQGVLENFSFGWEKYDIARVDRQKLGKLGKMISELKIGYFRLNAGMFDTFPAIY